MEHIKTTIFLMNLENCGSGCFVLQHTEHYKKVK